MTTEEKANAILGNTFGVEIEMTGITRYQAACVIRRLLDGTLERAGGYYDRYFVNVNNRKWGVCYDGSISRSGGPNTAVEVVTPILRYEDMDDLQKVVRGLRAAGATTNGSCGIHVHIGGEGHDVRSLKNLCNIIHAKGELIYEAIDIIEGRQRWAKLLTENLCRKLTSTRVKTMEDVKRVWYDVMQRNGYENEAAHYNTSRYYLLNLHSFFHGHGTVEFRGFNSELHAGKVRTYVLFCLAINHQALTQIRSSWKKVQMDNPRFAMGAWCQQMGMVGDLYKVPRSFLVGRLPGHQAYRH